MSTNPFDDDGGGGLLAGHRSNRSARFGVPPGGGDSLNRHPSYRRQGRSVRDVHGGGGGGGGGSSMGSGNSSHGGQQQQPDEEPIWTARSVEWPIPPSLSPGSYSRLARSSRQAGASLGIVVDGTVGTGGGGAGDAADKGKAADDGDGGGGPSGGAGGAAAGTAGGSGYIAGFMGKMWSGQSGAGGGVADAHADDDDPSSPNRPIRPPRARCVAAANGWIVAAVDCPSLAPSPVPPLRLASRWNVRRGASSSTPSADNLVPLPPPVRASDASSPHSVASTAIAHVFVDPTGCHTVLSARNGEAYYLHSTSRKARKLGGFGPNPDGSSGCTPGSTATGTGSVRPQVGLTPGSYVTAIGWDRKRGTEGSTKKILLGTSIGEVYEYSLVSPTLDGSDDGNDVGQADADSPPTLLHRLNSAEGGSGGGRGRGDGAAISGIHFERLGRGTASDPGAPAGAGEETLVLAATGGANKRTRLHTYRSAAAPGGSSGGSSAPLSPSSSSSSPSSSLTFAPVFAQNEGSHSSFIELPGSISFADLRICGDGFSLRTETGIYYGTIDRAGTGGGGIPTSGLGGGGMADAGILPYDQGIASTIGGSPIPTSMALTPHHFITLSDSNEVRFVNRVAKKVIQKERVDWVSMAQSTGDDHVLAGAAELLMDIRRPDQIWLRKSRSLVHISSSCEDRDVWKFTLEKCLEQRNYHGASGRGDGAEKQQDAQFEHAKSLCTNNTQKAVVTAARAEYHLSQGHVELAAKYMAQCPPTLMPFDNTAIRLALPMLGVDDPKGYGGSALAKDALGASNMGLITYLSDRMRLAKVKDDAVACTMIGAWLAELHLHERERGSAEHVSRSTSKHPRSRTTGSNALLHQFLSSNVHCMDAKTILRILSSHDVGATECSGYAASSGDIGTAVNAALCADDGRDGALDAIRVLNDSPIEQAEPYYYKHASTLLSRAPMASAKSFLAKYTQGLSATKLLPSFMHYERRRAEVKKMRALVGSGSSQPVAASQDSNSLESVRIERSRTYVDGVEVRIDGNVSHSGSFVDDEKASIKYLEGVIKLGCGSTAVYNYLISLYAAMSDEMPLYNFLSAHVPAASSKKAVGIGEALLRQGDRELSSPLDMSYALRVVLRTGRHFRSAVKLYMGFGMRQQAVELAIKVDPALARELARESVGPDEQKRLWLMIARNAAADSENSGGKDVVAKVVSVLNDCGPDVLSIEDVLPYLPDFAQIDQIQDEICSSLTSYSSKIEQYLKEMNECDQTCDALRDEISRLGIHATNMKGDARCAITNKLVLNANEPFYVFPSGYVFLESALMKEVMPYLNEKQRSRVKLITEELDKLKKRSTSDPIVTSPDNEFHLEELQAELDGLIAAECPFTGTVMVDSIDRGFLEEDESFDNSQWFETPIGQ